MFWKSTPPRKGYFAKASDAKRDQALRFWNAACILVAAVLFVSALLCCGRPMDLHQAAPHGYAHWTLQIFAAPCLALLSLVNVLCGWQDAAVVRFFTEVHPFVGLGLVALVWLAVIWLLIRRFGIRWFGSGGVRAAANFAMIFAVWGMLQLLFSGLMFLRENGGLDTFHAPGGEAAVTAPAAEKRE